MLPLKGLLLQSSLSLVEAAAAGVGMMTFSSRQSCIKGRVCHR